MSLLTPTPIEVRWVHGAGAVIFARLEAYPTAPNSRGTPYTQSQFSSLSLTITDITDPNNPTTVSGFSGVALTVSSVIFDTLQGWRKDPIGFNFKTTVGVTAFPVNGNKYRIDVKVTLNTGDPVGFLRWEGPADSTYGS